MRERMNEGRKMMRTEGVRRAGDKEVNRQTDI